MKRKQQYVAPAILRQTALSPGVALLANSIVDDAAIKSMGQKIDTYDFGAEGNTFNHEWED
ncbi:MAG: hypothetical protein IJL68_03595 [Bacteroidales bacterium]|nr:hypothetical protein [Bacteroidales bacterium]